MKHAQSSSLWSLYSIIHALMLYRPYDPHKDTISDFHHYQKAPYCYQCLPVHVNFFSLFCLSQVVVLVELLPISGIPNGSPVVGVSVLPADLVSTKPRLMVKSLVADSKPTKGLWYYEKGTSIVHYFVKKIKKCE
jgi:hypothetical protein